MADEIRFSMAGNEGPQFLELTHPIIKVSGENHEVYIDFIAQAKRGFSLRVTLTSEAAEFLKSKL